MFVRPMVLVAGAVACHSPPSPSAAVAVAAAVIVANPLSTPSLVAVSRCRSHSSAAAVLPIYRPPPPLPPFLVGGRHHCHLSSAVATPLVAGAGSMR